ncbi:molybdate ABC transporter substrate-binding protein [Bacillus lumedeiriae]
MKKAWHFLFLLCLLMIPLGCSNGEQPSTTSSKESNTNEAVSSKKTELIISSAASLTDALNELENSFESKHPNIDLTYNFGSSGKLVQQIEQGAPADVFLSASKQDMDTLQEKSLIQEESRSDFAKNEVVLITNKDHSLPLSSFEELSPKQIKHFAIGEPESVPVGRYTKEVLEHLKLWAPLQSKLVLGSDVRQVLTYVESGNADAGVVYSSDAMISDKVKVVAAAKPEWHEPIIYPGAVTSNSKHTKEAQAFLTYLTSKEGKEVFTKYGFK